MLIFVWMRRGLFGLSLVMTISLGALSCRRPDQSPYAVEVLTKLSADSLQVLLQKPLPDSIAVRVFGVLGDRLVTGDLDTAFRAAYSLWRAADEQQRPPLRARAAILLAKLHYMQQAFDSTIRYTTIAWQIGQALRDTGLIIQGLMNTGNGYDALSVLDTAILFHTSALQHAEAYRDTAFQVLILGNRAGSYLFSGRFQESEADLQRAIALGRNHPQSQTYLVAAYNGMGQLYYYQTRYSEALTAYLEALKHLSAVSGYDYLRIQIQNQIASIHFFEKQVDSALYYYRLALSTAQKARILSPGSYRGIGNCYYVQKKLDSAVSYYYLGLTLLEQLPNPHERAAVFNNLSNVYADQGKIDSAQHYLQVARAIYQQMGDVEGLAGTTINLAEVCRQTSRPHLARQYVREALQLADSVRSLSHQRDAHIELSYVDSILAEQTGQRAYWRSAFTSLRRALTYNDSIYNDENRRSLERVKARYEYDKREALIKAEQAQERSLAALKLREARRRWLLTMGGLGVISVAAVALGLLLRQVRQQKKALQVANNALESTNAVLRTTLGELEGSYRTIELQNRELAHKNQEITQSITYARRIQQALLPSSEKWEELLPRSGLLYLPRDIVAGDFYWLEETEEAVYVAVADATGHGVPGAFMSILCLNALRQAFHEEGIREPTAILDRTRSIISAQLTQHRTLRDGMDIGLIRLSKLKPGELSYAGANRTLWVKPPQNEMIELPGTKQAIGYVENPLPYANHDLLLPGTGYKPVSYTHLTLPTTERG